jgi:hypothetical protein
MGIINEFFRGPHDFDVVALKTTKLITEGRTYRVKRTVLRIVGASDYSYVIAECDDDQEHELDALLFVRKGLGHRNYQPSAEPVVMQEFEVEVMGIKAEIQALRAKAEARHLLRTAHCLGKAERSIMMDLKAGKRARK